MSWVTLLMLECSSFASSNVETDHPCGIQLCCGQVGFTIHKLIQKTPKQKGFPAQAIKKKITGSIDFLLMMIFQQYQFQNPPGHGFAGCHQIEESTALGFDATASSGCSGGRTEATWGWLLVRWMRKNKTSGIFQKLRPCWSQMYVNYVNIAHMDRILVVLQAIHFLCFSLGFTPWVRFISWLVFIHWTSLDGVRHGKTPRFVDVGIFIGPCHLNSGKPVDSG